jgi:hypothetical protein
MQRGTDLTAQLLRTFDAAVERCLFALEAAIRPELSPHALPPVRAACTTLEALLRRGGNWASWDPEQPDAWQ